MNEPILAGAVATLSGTVRRVTAPNPGFMTGPGTNSYLLGNGGDLAVIDPGPANPAHLEALLKAGEGRIRWILATHTHPDHSPAAALLKAETGATLLGMKPPPQDNQDQSFRPDEVLADGDQLELGDCRIRVIHTPGHASNHLCYRLEDERMLFTGDHIMQGSTVVIGPPDGDMIAYIDSLRRLQDEDLATLAPGHGYPIDDPQATIESLLRHRRARENKVLNALKAENDLSLDQLTPRVYDDVPVHKHAMAARSLLAHLIKLRIEGRVVEDSENWRIEAA